MLLPELLSPAAATAKLIRLHPTADQLAGFKGHLAEMLRHLDRKKIERHGETHILDFLRMVTRPLEGGTRYGNVDMKRDLVLHLGDTADTPVGVVLEVKGPKNSAEMLTASDLNRKAFQQLLLYYLEDRDNKKANDFRRLIVTTGFEWYIFDALDFDTLFWDDKAFVKSFREWKAGAKASKKTSLFYDGIASDKLVALAGTMKVVYVDLSSGLPTDQAALTQLYRVFHPSYLLKEPLPTRPDANTLNQDFYNELLYLMGLQEQSKGKVRSIVRCPEDRRQPGSLLENTLRKLSVGRLRNLSAEELASYGKTYDKQQEEVAVALCLMWVNRLLFLKLLEGQLVRYHTPEHAARFRFLQPDKLTDYNEVLTLFFDVLNRAPDQRAAGIAAAYPQVPYLNSSLFEPSTLEAKTFDIGGLRNGLGLAPYPGSVLRKSGTRQPRNADASTKAVPQWDALPYLLSFLDAYDFSTDPLDHSGPGPDGPAPAEAARPLLSAAVLGLVFEKINGYKDGSFYTPGFVTMYMAQQTLTRAVLHHFNQAPDLPQLVACQTFGDLQDKLQNASRPERQQYAAHFNTLTVLDPAVGSGHFLVSALNELLVLKSRLGLFLNEEGGLQPYRLKVKQDELLVTDLDGQPVPYRVATFDPGTGQRTVGPPRTQLQKALFQEKRALMEHTLFGVDINPNSVRICRLRLWIELLKHAYYKPETNYQELETLPNLELNVKTGNSLLARFGLEDDLSEANERAGFSLNDYRTASHDYYGSRGQEDKERLLATLSQLKDQFTVVLHKKDKKREDLRLAINQRQVRINYIPLFPETPKQQQVRQKAIDRLTKDIDKLTARVNSYEEGAKFREAFEWRFEFPEVLDDAGAFVGFDVVIGNPPYITKIKDAHIKQFLRKNFVTSQYQLDLYVAFIEMSTRLLKPGGEVSFITPNSWLKNTNFSKLRKFVLDNLHLNLLIPNLPSVFAEANVDSAIFFARKGPATDLLEVGHLDNTSFRTRHFVNMARFHTNDRYVFDAGMDDETAAIIQTIRKKSIQLNEISDITRGVNSYDKARGQSEEVILTRAYHANHQKDASFVPELKGKHVKPYRYNWDEKSFISYGSWLAAPREDKYFKGERIIMRQVLGSTLFCTLITEDMIIDQSVFIAKLKPDKSDYLPAFVLGALASRVTAFYFKHSANEFDELFPKIKIGEFRELPIPVATPGEQAAIAALVTGILAAKSTDPTTDTRTAENAVHAAVAALYDVTLPTETTVLEPVTIVEVAQ